jgi:hypothetical protein
MGGPAEGRKRRVLEKNSYGMRRAAASGARRACGAEEEDRVPRRGRGEGAKSESFRVCRPDLNHHLR